jgi:hypothetical protein
MQKLPICLERDPILQAHSGGAQWFQVRCCVPTGKEPIQGFSVLPVPAWAFSEAAEFARRYDDKARAFYNRKLRKINFMIAHAALAHKLARAAYHVMKDGVDFMPEKIFTYELAGAVSLHWGW